MKFAVVILVVALAAAEVAACTTFCLKDGTQIVFGRNYDWDVNVALLIVNKRSVSKTAMSQQFERPAQWTSRYGSLTFNQYGREFPTGGINEAGLVVELMMLQESIYPPHDQRPIVGGLEWIQYQLDNSGTIADVIQKSNEIRISSSVKLHFLVCERSGACVTVEFLNGAFSPHHGATLPISALTNDTYARSIDYLHTLAGFGGNATPQGSGSLERFGRAATMMKNYGSGQGIVNYAFQMLGSVAQGDYTKWSIVYDLANLRVYFRTSSSREIKYLDLAKLNFSCGANVQVLNINTIKPGDVFKRLQKYSTALNRNLVQQAYAQTPFLIGTPASEIESVVNHPESFTCNLN